MTSRKLQAEIDRTLKKLKEGQNNFDAILIKWEAARKSKHNQQREKMKIELKREIKRLQRHRETVKQWLNSPSIKDKSKLRLVKRSVEDRMECFKRCERCTKTIEYSIDSLAALKFSQEQEIEINSSKRHLNDEQQQAIEWIEGMCKKINKQLSEFRLEFDKYEEIIQNFSKIRNKKKLRTGYECNLECLRSKIERHSWHINKLQMCQQKIIEKKVMADLYETTIKDAVEYYVNESMDDDVEFFCETLFEDFENAIEVIDLYLKQKNVDDDRKKKKKKSKRKIKKKSKSKQKKKNTNFAKNTNSNNTDSRSTIHHSPIYQSQSLKRNGHSHYDDNYYQKHNSYTNIAHTKEDPRAHNGYANNFENHKTVQSFSASVLEKQRKKNAINSNIKQKFEKSL